MKKTQDAVVLNDAYHTIKSPIVSIKSMLFVLGKNKDIEKNKIVQDKIFQIEEKLNVLHRRAEIFLNYIVFKEGTVEFLYSFFNFDEALQKAIDTIHKQYGNRFGFKKPINQPIMADEAHIVEALRIILSGIHKKANLGIIPVSVASQGRNVDVIARYAIESGTEDKPPDRDEENVLRQEEYIATRIVELHGGRVSKEQNGAEVEVRISLPMKARASKRK